MSTIRRPDYPRPRSGRLSYVSLTVGRATRVRQLTSRGTGLCLAAGKE